MKTPTMTDTSPLSILTTDRPLTNADREQIWRDSITSPLEQGQPQHVSFLSVFRDVLGWALLAVTGVAFLALMQWSMEAV